MDLRALQCFVAVARHGHVTRAAQDLYLTQSAVSQQLRRLEAELGLALLRRGSRGVTLTSAGEELLPRAQAILSDVDRARAAMAEHAAVSRGAVRGAAATGDALGLPRALVAFNREHPGIRVALRHAGAGPVADLVRRGSADLGVAAAAPAGLDAAPLSSEPLIVLLPEGEPATPVSLQRLRERAFILAEPGTLLRDTVMAACEVAGFGPVPLFEVSDPVTVRTLVTAGLGVALVPASWAAPPLTVAPLAGAELVHQPRLLTRPDGVSAAATLLHGHLQRAL